jgi:hypothetical protein
MTVCEQKSRKKRQPRFCPCLLYMCTQVWSSSKEVLCRRLGAQTGAALWQHAHGIDERPVAPPKARRTVGAEVNWGVRFSTQQEADTFLKVCGCAALGQFANTYAASFCVDPSRCCQCSCHVSYSITIPSTITCVHMYLHCRSCVLTFQRTSAASARALHSYPTIRLLPSCTCVMRHHCRSCVLRCRHGWLLPVLVPSASPSS